MKTLLVMRHAKSSWKNSQLADHDRPLNERGKRDAPRMGAWLQQQELTPDLIISSTAKRARKTAELAAEQCDYAGEITLTRDFYHADPETYLAVLQRVDDGYGRVLIVGHNPGMAELVEWLSGSEHRFTTANIAHFTLPIATWRELTPVINADLLHLWRPKELL